MSKSVATGVPLVNPNPDHALAAMRLADQMIRACYPSPRKAIREIPSAAEGMGDDPRVDYVGEVSR